MRILFIIGTRPEAVKLCPLVLEMRKCESFEIEVLLTGQHMECAEDVMREFGVEFGQNLGIMREGQSLSGMCERLFGALDEYLRDKQFDYAVVQGDTCSAMVGCVASFFHGIPVIHIEAGLRSGDNLSPFPEEVNRKIIATVASLHFAPNKYAKYALRREGVGGKVFVVGNTVTDAVRYCLSKRDKHICRERRYVLLTLHRRENEGVAGGIIKGIRHLAADFPDIDFIFVKHPKLKGYITKENFIVSAPMPVLEFQSLLSGAVMAISDSGGVQEEGAMLGVPVLVPRERTERIYEMRKGMVRLCPRTEQGIYKTARKLLEDLVKNQKRHKIKKHDSVSAKIVMILKRELLNEI